MTNATAKGSVLHTTMDYVRAEKGGEMLETILRRLSEEQRRQIEASTPTQELPFDLVLSLWQAVDAELGTEDPGWIERSGAHSIHSMGVQLYSGSADWSPIARLGSRTLSRMISTSVSFTTPRSWYLVIGICRPSE